MKYLQQKVAKPSRTEWNVEVQQKRKIKATQMVLECENEESERKE